jgi:hypothetical protein
MVRELGGFILTFESQDLRRLMAAEGYIELGMYDEAAEELDQIDSFSPIVSHVLALRLCTYAGLAKWNLMEAVLRTSRGIIRMIRSGLFGGRMRRQGANQLKEQKKF